MKNATLRQLAVFETVARHLHFTRAAEELGTTQPSVSIQVKQLEDNLDIPLFEQLGKRFSRVAETFKDLVLPAAQQHVQGNAASDQRAIRVRAGSRAK